VVAVGWFGDTREEIHPVTQQLKPTHALLFHSQGRLRRLSVENAAVQDSKICLTPELDGEWVEQNVSSWADNPDAVQAASFQAFERCENFTDTFQWKAKGLRVWDPNAFCRTLGNRTIAVIGDSTMRQSAKVLTGMVYLGGCDSQVRFHSADTLILEPMGALNRGAYWTDWLRQKRPDIVVASAGSHIITDANFTRMFDKAMADIEEIKKEQPNMQIVWKTQNPAGGHPTRGAYANARQTGHPIEVARRLTSNKLWNHQLFWNRDNTIIPQLQQRGIPFLDMRMLYNRIDAHPWQHGDCLHFCMPGPLDIFPLLLQRLMENSFEVSKCIKMI
jgi:hypothetical protein